ncbi:peptidylprolyl isomerase [Neisseriaceae bacterium B1]
MIKLHTNFGVIGIELDHENAPNTAHNFEQYVQDGFYNGVIFHRVIKGFMIQGGGMDSDMNEKETRAPIQNEAHNGLKNEKYTIAMARTSDPHSASAQFFINTNNNDFLNFRGKELHGRPVVQEWGYAVFGKVVEGQDVVDAIEAVKTKSHGYHDDVPVDAVVINKAEVV